MPRHLNIRSFLFTPADKPQIFEKAISSDADLVIFDLEDAVSISNKEAARKNIKSYFSSKTNDKRLAGIRINSLKTIAGVEDLLLLSGMETLPAALVIPKLESHYELRIINQLIPEIAEQTAVIGLIETAYALANLADIVIPGFGLSALVLGAADLSSDLGCSNTYDNLLVARTQLVTAAASAGLEAIDSPFFDLKDPVALENETNKIAALGFTAKAAIHPAQLAVINHIFTPTSEQVTEAKEIIDMAQKGVGVLNGKMVDHAMAVKAKKVVAKAEFLNNKL
jgi:(S)-citramalyl-CoA lyase